MTVPFVNHHVHSHFSALDGLSRPDDIVQRVVEMGQKSISITDHGTMAAIPQMYDAARKAGIGFTPGIEAYFTKDRHYKSKGRNRSQEGGKDTPYYHLLMLATSNEGYSNLVKMQTPSWEEGYYYKPRLDYEVLEQYSKGIVVTTSCLSGIISRLLLQGRYKDALAEADTLVQIFGKENVFVELQRHGIEAQEKILGDLLRISKDLDLPLLATTDSHYTREEDHSVHDTLLCCSAGGNKFSQNRFKFDSTKNFLHTGEQMLELFPEADFPNAVTNSYELALRSEDSGFSLPMDERKYILPTVKVDEGKTEMETIRQKVYEGARDPSRYGDENGNISPKVKERIEYELGVIEQMGFPGYFLIVANYIQLFRDNGIVVGHGRGCLTKDSTVLTNRGWVNIDKVNPGDIVIDSLGKNSKVLERHEYPVRVGEKLVALKNEAGEKITLTRKHKVLSMTRSGERKWVEAFRIRPGDNIAYVTGSYEKQFQYFDEVTASSENDHSRPRVLKTFEWGYICAMIMVHADINRQWKTARWYFDENTVLVGETLLSLLLQVCDENLVEQKRNPQGLLTELVLRDKDMVSWVMQRRIAQDYLIGTGGKDYSFGFLQALQSSFSAPLCSPNIVHVGDDLIAEMVYNCATSAGLRASFDNGTVFIHTAENFGIQKLHTVIDVAEVTPGEDDEMVYDLTVEGSASFLTNFGTVKNSAPGSVVVYCLGITNIDPFRHNLFFERFLNPDRISMPDIDIDIPKNRREEALMLLEEEYGHGHVAQITNYSTMATKASLERVAKAYGMTPSQAAEVKKAVEEYCELHQTTLQGMVEDGAIPQEVATGEIGKYIKNILSDAAKIDGTISSYGTHACGIVITTNRVDEYFPIRFNIDSKTKKPVGLPICQFDGKDIERLGGVKMDVLGLTNLDQATDTERNIRLDLHEEVDAFNLPLDDEETYDLLARGAGGDVFQLGCLAGDTIVEGRKISHWYQLRHSTQRLTTTNSVFLGLGHVHRNNVFQTVYSGKKDTILLTFEDGTNLQCTPNHHIFTPSGWVKAGELDTTSKVLQVDEDIDGSLFQATIRGKEDVFDMFEAMHPDLVRVKDPYVITTETTTIYPTFHTYGNFKDFVYIYPDEFYSTAKRAVDEIAAEDRGRTIQIYSYSQVVERFYREHGLVEDHMLPIGTKFLRVSSIEDAGVVDTYDIMMKKPVNNFIANGIMVHNSDAAESMLKKMRPTNFEDISASLALNRPGPISIGIPDQYAERKNAPKGSDYEVFHEDARELLGDSYGLLVYQEDIMAISQKFAGYTGGEADTLRKAMGKKDAKLMSQQEGKFVKAVNERYPEEKDLGERIWAMIRPFGEYAFNRSHSAAYARLSHLTAYLKTHYTPQFAGACIDNNITSKKDLLETMRWIRAEGVKILPPNINLSQMRTVTTDDSVTLPLDIIDGVGATQAQAMIDEREANGDYVDVLDVVARNKISENMLITMAKAGVFDCFDTPRANVVRFAPDLIVESRLLKSRNSFMSDSIFGFLEEQQEEPEQQSELMKTINDAPKMGFTGSNGKEIPVDNDLYATWERESLGFIVGPHPFETVRKLVMAPQLFAKYPPVDVIHKPTGGRWDDTEQFCGIISNIENRVSKKGNKYSRFTIETENRTIPCMFFNRDKDDPEKDWIDEEWEGSLVFVDGKVKNDAQDEYMQSKAEKDGVDIDENEFIPSMMCGKVGRFNLQRMKEKGMVEDTKAGV